MTDEILDTIETTPPRMQISLFGKIFYVLEVVLWTCLFIAMFTMFYFSIMTAPLVLVVFYLILGPLFAFFSRAFPTIWDKFVVATGFVAIPLILAGIAFTFSSWPYGREISILSPILGVSSLAYIIVQLIKGTTPLAVRHFRIMLIRLIPTVLIGVYIVYVTMR